MYATQAGARRAAERLNEKSPDPIDVWEVAHIPGRPKPWVIYNAGKELALARGADIEYSPAAEAARALASLRKRGRFTCAVCGREFEAVRIKGDGPRYCGNAHKVFAYHQRRKAARAPE